MVTNTPFQTKPQMVIRFALAGAFLFILLFAFLHDVLAPATIMARPLVPAPQAAAHLKGIVSDPVRHHLFVARYNANSVTVFDEMLTPLPLITTVPVGTGPFGIGLVDDKVYVANWGSQSEPSSVTVISAQTLQKVTDISVGSCGSSAAHIAVDPGNHRVYASIYANPGRVAVIDSTDDSLVTCAETNAGTFGIAAHPASSSVFAGNRDGLDLWRIDGKTNMATAVVNWRSDSGGSPYFVSVNPSTSKLFALVGLPDSSIPNRLYAYDIGASGTLGAAGVVTVGNTDDGGYVLQATSQCSFNAGLIYVAATFDNTVWILNSDLSHRNTLYAADGIGTEPFSLAEDPVLRRIYVGNKGDGTLSVLDACTGQFAANLSLFLPFIAR